MELSYRIETPEAAQEVAKWNKMKQVVVNKVEQQAQGWHANSWSVPYFEVFCHISRFFCHSSLFYFPLKTVLRGFLPFFSVLLSFENTFFVVVVRRPAAGGHFRPFVAAIHQPLTTVVLISRCSTMTCRQMAILTMVISPVFWSVENLNYVFVLLHECFVIKVIMKP